MTNYKILVKTFFFLFFTFTLYFFSSQSAHAYSLIYAQGTESETFDFGSQVIAPEGEFQTFTVSQEVDLVGLRAKTDYSDSCGARWEITWDEFNYSSEQLSGGEIQDDINDPTWFSFSGGTLYPDTEYQIKFIGTNYGCSPSYKVKGVSFGDDDYAYFYLYGGDLLPIELTYPVPFSANQILSDVPIFQYSLSSTGYCKTNGSDRIYVHTEPSSYVPTTTDFTVDCIEHEWSSSDSGLLEGENYITYWAKDFIDESREPVYGEDYVDTLVYLYINQSFDPGAWTTSTTSTIDFSDIPFIGDKLQNIYSGLLNKIPIGYFIQIYDAWNDATTTGETTEITFDFSFNNKFPELAGLEWTLVDLADPYAGLNASTTATIEDIVDFIDYVIYFIATFFFLNWIVDTYKRFINHDNV